MIKGPHIEVLPDGDFDKIVVSSDVGKSGTTILYEFYPDDNVSYVIVGDGTILKYDFSNSHKLSLVKKGSLYTDTIPKGKFYSDLMTFSELDLVAVSSDVYMRM